MEYLERNGSRVWTARTPTAMETCFGWPAAVCNLDVSIVSPCTSPKTCGRLLLAGQVTVAQMRQTFFVVRDGDSLGYFFIAFSGMSAHLYVTSGSRLHVHYSAAREKLPREALLMQALQSLQISVLVGRGYV